MNYEEGSLCNYRARYTPVFIGQPPFMPDMQEIMGLLELNDSIFTHEKQKCARGKIIRFRFANGWGASVITTAYSFGNQDEWELGLIRYISGDENEDGEYILDFNEEFCDVFGCLDWDDVEDILSKIEKLEPHETVDKPNNVVQLQIRKPNK